MGRRRKPKKVAAAKRPLVRKSRNDSAGKAPDPETRLAEVQGQLRTRDRELAEALEQRSATAEILHVIRSSPKDVQPVFDTIVRSAVRLCDGLHGFVGRFDGELIHFAAQHNYTPEALEMVQRMYPLRPDRTQAAGRAILTGDVVNIADVQADPEYATDLAVAGGWRSILNVPMLREGKPIGTIGVIRGQAGRFSDAQVELLQTFADQAVIAIENTRLFNELGARNRDLLEALERQTATAEILRVISSSPTGVQPTFDAIARSAALLCRADLSGVHRFDGELIHFAAQYGRTAEEIEAVRQAFPQRPSRASATARCILSAAVVQVADHHDDPDIVDSLRMFRTVLAVPMLRDGRPVGSISVARRVVNPFTDDQVDLLKTFAAQAVIAIENVRLFEELGARNRDLTEALDQQTATAEILRTIAHAQSDAQPVFDTIVRSAARLCKSVMASVLLTDGRMLYLPANYGSSPEALAAVRARFPIPLDTATASGAAIVTRSVGNVPDVEDPSVAEFTRQAGRLLGYRSLVTVPMRREGEVVGAINVCRREPGRFSDAEVALLQTFAAQAVIAIENVRLFTELQASNRDLTTALEKQTATSEILHVISRSPTDVQPVFDAIVGSAVRLMGAYSGGLTRISSDQIVLGAITSTDPSGDDVQRTRYPQPLDSDDPHAQAIRSRVPLNVTDAQEDLRFPEPVRVAARARGFRSLVAVPLLQHDEPLGAITVTRRQAGGFTDDEIALLETFADQAVIAIENARLFKELEDRNRALTEAHAQVRQALDRQTATADILRVISQSQAEVQPVFDAIIDNAMRLFRAWAAAIFRSDGTLLHLIAARGGLPESEQQLREQSPWPIDGTLPAGRCVADRTVVHIPDPEADPTLDPAIQHLARTRGWRSCLGAPMLREGQPIGAITVTRAETGSFSPAEIALLQTFADQAVIAIENARLLTELRARTEELTRSVEQLTALGEVGQAVSSSLDLETVLTTIVSRAVQLSGLDGGTVFEYEEASEEFVQRATTGTARVLAGRAVVHKGEGVVGRTAVTFEPVQTSDIRVDGTYESRLRTALLGAGVRAIIAVPIIREGRLLGGFAVNRNTPGGFPPETIELLRTFATQSALAIQNARLFRDLADKSRQLEAASQHKSEFLANMSHELRTPLNAIIGYSELLEEEAAEADAGRLVPDLQKIATAAKHQLSLINDILDLSKIEAGRMELELADFDLSTAIDDALALVRERAARRGIALGRTLDRSAGSIRADERKVKQVLLNLLSNALKFTPEGGRIDVRAAMNEGLAEISVADTGVGIAPEDQEAVFEAFRQVGTADKKVEGTGLGLALCRRFVELHGGRIWVKSQPGQGSTFAFTLPVRREG